MLIQHPITKTFTKWPDTVCCYVCSRHDGHLKVTGLHTQRSVSGGTREVRRCSQHSFASGQSSNAQANTHACLWAQQGCGWGFRPEYLNTIRSKWVSALDTQITWMGGWRSGLCCRGCFEKFLFWYCENFLADHSSLYCAKKKRNETLLQSPLRSTKFKCFIVKRYCRFWVEYVSLIACRCLGNSPHCLSALWRDSLLVLF